MYTIKIQDWLGQDSEQLREEYKKEDKAIYQQMFDKYVSLHKRDLLKKNQINDFSTSEYYLQHPQQFKLGISIFVDRYVSINTSFYALFDLNDYAEILRKDVGFRRFTKLCFYIMETVKPRY